MVSRKLVSLQQHDTPSVLCQDGGGRRSSRPAADHDGIVVFVSHGLGVSGYRKTIGSTSTISPIFEPFLTICVRRPYRTRGSRIQNTGVWPPGRTSICEDIHLSNAAKISEMFVWATEEV